MNNNQDEEMRDALTSLLLCEKLNPEAPMLLKLSAAAISSRMMHTANYEFLMFVRRSPNPAGVVHRELEKQPYARLFA